MKGDGSRFLDDGPISEQPRVHDRVVAEALSRVAARDIEKVCDRTNTIPWEVHGENLAEPTRGELTLKIITEVEEGAPITSLDELLATARKGGKEDNDAEE